MPTKKQSVARSTGFLPQRICVWVRTPVAPTAHARRNSAGTSPAWINTIRNSATGLATRSEA